MSEVLFKSAAAQS